ncbi:MAG TPA: amidohydrolase family protein [Acidimicrobiales bacterium]|nr:amidohydrolase family protein [Acidimicrobiales bacterium]
MSEMPFVDTHVHYYDLKDPDLCYSWLQPDFVHPIIGDIDGIKAQRYDANTYIAEARFSNVTKCVHVQAALGIKDPVKETEWLEAMAKRTGFPHAMVAHSDLARPDIGDELGRHMAASSRLRGIRDFGQGDYLVDPAWRRGCAALATHGLLLGLDTIWENMGKAKDLAAEVPDLIILVDHAGFPRSRTEEYFTHWSAAMSDLAEADNVYCKISGLGMCDQRWTIESIRPWVLYCLEAFGVERCVMGTNWPVDRLFSSYDPVVNAYTEIIKDFSKAEQEALFFRNAETLFRI